MALSGLSSVKSKKRSWNISTALASAASEWLLMCMLFINAIFSYLITKFACQWKLQTPCLLCSRLDHILGSKTLKYYWDLICGNHKLEISSLVFCHSHNNLVDVHGMCENCLFSFAAINKSNAETYRLLVGKLGEDSGFVLDQDSQQDDHGSVTRQCSCCNEPWIPRGYCQKLMRAISAGSGAADLDFPLSDSIKHDCSNLEKSKQSIPLRSTRQKTSGFDHLSHVGYSELNFQSDTESEAMLSDDNGENAVREDLAVEYLKSEPCTVSLVDDSVTEKLIDPASSPDPSILASKVQSDVIRVPVEHGLEELNWQQADCKADSSTLPDLISHDNVPPSSIARESPQKASKEREIISPDDVLQISYAKETPPEASDENRIVSVDNVLPSTERRNPAKISQESELISIVDSLPSTNGAENPVQGLKESCGEDFGKGEIQPARRNDTASEINPSSSDNGQQPANSLDLSDAYKLAVGNRGRQLSVVLAEQKTVKDSPRLSEDLKHLLSQLSAAREQSMNDMSPRKVPISPRVTISPKLSTNSDEVKTSDTSSIMGMQILQKRITLERNESGLSLDGSIVSEIEGESEIDRLKRQVEHDKKVLSALYKELEEEKNASTIAVNQAMAMITRIQEEKATLHMESLQCLRMMEEQAEYDMEALQKTNDLLAEKEKEVQDLEEELEFYRSKFSNEVIFGTPFSDRKATGSRADPSEAGCEEDSAGTSRNSFKEKQVEGANKNIITGNSSSLFEFEDEQSYITQSLKKLKRKLHLFSNNGLSLESINKYPGDKENDSREQNSEVGVEQNGGAEEKSSSSHQELDLDSLVNEVSDLSQKLEALEADQNFLEHSINSIKYGEEGVQFIQEIASHLKELRKIGIQQREQITA
uniref:GTD-binding domain-containing protein n=1 Tax=Salix viminalis TaxID=40686 RepID=A0A6N2LVR9_SALVM